MLKNIKIRHKLLLMVMSPLIAMFIFSLSSVRDHYLLLRGLEQTETLTRLAVEVGSLTHEIQKERGYSSGYLNAKGEKFREDLSKQREQVDLKLKGVKNYLAAHESVLGTVNKSLETAAANITKLPETRVGVDSLKLSGADSYAYYTAVIDSYLDVVAAVATTSGKREVMREATAYYAFVKAKEEVGRERATLNAVITADRFDDEKFQRVFNIAGAQRTYIDLFQKYGSAESLALYDEKAQSPSFQKALEMRGAVLSKGMAGGFGIAPEAWFTVATYKINTMKEVEDHLSKEILATAGTLATQAKSSLVASIVFTIVAAFVTLALGFVIMLGITKPLSRMLHMLKDIAEGEGDLTRRLKEDRRDELGEVSVWFNRFVDNVHGIVSQLASNTMQVSSSCAQLNRTAEQIATAAEEVASQSGTVATASEEMSATSNEISGSCAQAAASSNRASDTAKGGADVVQQTLLGMQNIAARVQESARTVASLGERSDQIGAIVGTIEDIADQTNLLALNAAIEAARAGEQGRGFAVVADEVRALAERTTRATREIGEMIKAIQSETGGAVSSMKLGVDEVEKGMESSRKSGEALHNILGAINDVTAQIHQIATAAEEQTAVTGEISSNIHQINDVVSETAKGAHETANAAAHLSTLALDLQRIVGRFRLA
jgi:methyl-accepting chemotaxis protein